MVSTIGELQAGTGHQVADRPRYQHAAGVRSCGDASAGDDGDARQLALVQLAFADVDADADLQAQRAARR